MSRVLTLRTRIYALALAATWSAASLFAAVSPSPVQAQAPNAPYYRAELVKPADSSQTIAGGLVWQCSKTSCFADKGSSRPLRVCRELNRKLGEVTQFAARDESMSSEDLARCNA